MKYRKAVFVVTYSIIEDKIYYLLLKRKLHWKGWEFPKGGLETLKEKLFVKSAVRREIVEETGLTPVSIKSMNFFGKYKYKKELKDRPGVMGQKYQLYAAQVPMEEVTLSANGDAEHSDYKWVEFKKAIKLLKWPNQKKCLKMVNRFLSN